MLIRSRSFSIPLVALVMDQRSPTRDRMCTDADARWLVDALSNCPLKGDVKISRATHLMHLEEN
jgi:hypothetical protein